MSRIASLVVACCLVVLGCREGAEGGKSPGGAGVVAAASVDSRCPEGKVVSTGDRESPEGTLFLAFQAAMGPDDEAGFAAFRALWHPDALTSHVREQIWPRVREHVGKYVAGPGDATYTACRRVDLGGGRIKVFARCDAPEKSDPPTILLATESGWVIEVMTP